MCVAWCPRCGSLGPPPHINIAVIFNAHNTGILSKLTVQKLVEHAGVQAAGLQLIPPCFGLYHRLQRLFRLLDILADLVIAKRVGQCEAIALVLP